MKTLILCLFSAISLYASIKSGSLCAVEYSSSLSRNATVNSVDAVFTNPAGVTLLQDGFYVYLVNNSMFSTKEAKNSVFNKTYVLKSKNIFLPVGAALYKKDKLGVFLSFSYPGISAGGQADNGILVMDAVAAVTSGALSQALNSKVSVSAQNKSFEFGGGALGVTVGAAYQLIPMISISAAIMPVYGYDFLKGGYDLVLPSGVVVSRQKIDTRSEAKYAGGIFGLNLKLHEKINLGFRYQTKVKLEYTQETKVDSFVPNKISYADGKKTRGDLPALAGAGAGIQILPNLMTQLSVTYFFQKDANYKGKDPNYTLYQNSYIAAAGAEYQFCKLMGISAGYAYRNNGVNENTLNSTAINNSYHSVAGGLSLVVSPRISFKAGYIQSICIDAKGKEVLEGTSLGDDDLTFVTRAISIGTQIKF